MACSHVSIATRLCACTHAATAPVRLRVLRVTPCRTSMAAALDQKRVQKTLRRPERRPPALARPAAVRQIARWAMAVAFQMSFTHRSERTHHTPIGLGRARCNLAIT